MRIIITFFILIFSFQNNYGLDGKVLQAKFVSNITGKEIPYAIYLPPNYESETSGYPLIFHLHGIGGTYNGNQIKEVPASYEMALYKDLISKVIIVFPDGFNDAFWSDSKNSDKPAESNLIKELIPYIKSNYRVKGNCIAIQGFSMGGFGASKIFSKYPDLFCSLISYDGAFLNVDGMIKFHNKVWLEIFDGDSLYFKDNSPWEFFQSNAEKLKTKPIRILKGSLGYNVDFNKHLLNLGYAHDYVETGCDHVLKCILDAQGEFSWIKHQIAFAVCEQTSIFDRQTWTNYNLSPNPAKDYIEINLERCATLAKCDTSEIKIYNTFGECVMEMQDVRHLGDVGHLNRIDISHLPAGVYYIKIGNYLEIFMLVR